MVNRKGQYYGKRTIRSSRGRKLRQRAPYTMTKSGDSEFMTDLEPPTSYKTKCELVGTGGFKKAYDCNKLKTPVVVKNTKGDDITISNDFVLYKPSAYIINEARTDPYNAVNEFQSSITNMMNVATYDDIVKGFFLNPIDSIKYVENNVEYTTLLVPSMIQLSETPGNADKLIKMTEEYMDRLITLFVKNYSEATLRDIVYKYLPTDIKPDNYLVDPTTGSIVFSDLEFLPSGGYFSRYSVTYTPSYVSRVTELPFEMTSWFYRNGRNVTRDTFNGLNMLRMFTISVINSVLKISGNPLIPGLSMSHITVANQLIDTLNKISQYNRFSKIIKYVEMLEMLISGCRDDDRSPTDDKLFYDGMLASPELMKGGEVALFSRGRIDMIDNACYNMKQGYKILIEGGAEAVGISDTVDTGSKDKEELDDRNFFNYILYIEQDPQTGVWATKMERTRVRMFDVGSKHAHIVLNKIVPRGRNWYFLASGEIYRRGGPVDGQTWFNFQSGMFYNSWSKVDVKRLLSSFVNNVTSTNNSKAFKKMVIALVRMYVNGAYDFMNIFQVILQSYFTNVKNYPNVVFSPDQFRDYNPLPIKSSNDPLCNIYGFRYIRYKKYNDCINNINGVDLCNVEPIKDERNGTEDAEFQANVRTIVSITGESEDIVRNALTVSYGSVIEALELLGRSDLVG